VNSRESTNGEVDDFWAERLSERGIVYFRAVDAVAETFLWPATVGEPSSPFCDNLPDVARLTVTSGSPSPRAFTATALAANEVRSTAPQHRHREHMRSFAAFTCSISTNLIH
jgi:hypothetical protein